jgi:hypothetical protein
LTGDFHRQATLQRHGQAQPGLGGLPGSALAERLLLIDA